MTRFHQQEASKGSQKWIQVLVNHKKDVINKEIRTSLQLPENETIEWFSPLESENFKEYKDEEFLVKLGINLKGVKLHEFWPRSGPRWDALAKSSSGKLILVEAKSHITELMSDFRGNNQTSINQIQNSLNATKRRFGVKESYDWTKLFYQYANRIAHVNWLSKQGYDARLINLYFLNDKEMEGPQTKEEWRGALRLMHRCLGLREHLIRDLGFDLFIDVKTL
jgi:hypothetical protein